MDGKYLLKRGRTWYVRFAIPHTVQDIFGKQEFVQSLKTKDFQEAKLLKQKYLDRCAQIAFALTGGTYFITSWNGQRTKTDLSQFSGMLTFALIGLIIASVFSIFFASTMLSWIINIGGVIIFSVLNAVDSQQLKYVSSDDEAVMASVGIYLNVINLFSFFMSIIGMSSDE